MNKKEIVSIAAEISGLPKQTLHKYFDILIESTAIAINEGKPVTISNFGTFKVKEQKERYVTNPQNGERVLTPAKKKVVFKTSPGLIKKKIYYNK
ncbi:MAG: HU family DNA-binding protein [Dysgonomonas sp.]